MIGLRILFLATGLSVGARAWAENDPSSPTPMTLTQAKTIALEKNPEIALARAKVDERRAVLRLNQGAFLPKIGIVSGGNIWNIDASRATKPLLYLYGTYNVFNGFQDTRNASVNQRTMEKAEISYEKIKHLIQLDVESNFNAYLFANEAIALKQKALATNRQLADAAEKRRVSGAASDADILEFELRENILRSELASFEQEREESRLAFIKALGHKDFDATLPTGSLDHQHIKGTLADYTRILTQQSYVSKEATIDVDIASDQAATWQSRWMPKIDLEARHGKIELRDAPVDSQVTTEILLLARIELFSGLESIHEKHRGLALRSQAEDAQRATLMSAESELARNFSRLTTLQQNVDFEEKNEERSRKYYQTVLREYNAGIKNSIDLKVAADLVYESSLKILRYKLAFLNARCDLERLLGSSVDVEIIHQAH